MAIDMVDTMPGAKGLLATMHHFDGLMYESHNIVTASDLYAYHILPSIIADLEAMGVTTDQEYHADVQAEMRWDFLDAQQQAYWKKRVKKYRAGYLGPLDSSTYEHFCSKRDLLQDDHESDSDDTREASKGLTSPFNFLCAPAVPQFDTTGVRSDDLLANSISHIPNHASLIHNPHSNVCRPFTASVAKVSPQAQMSYAPSPPAASRKPKAVMPTAVPKTSIPAQHLANGNKFHPSAAPSPLTVAPTQQKAQKKQKPIKAKGVQENKYDNSILHLLGGPVMRSKTPDYTTGIAAILRSISKRLGQDPGLTFQGRCRSKRVDFDTRARGVTSIRERLAQAVERGEWINLDDRKLWTPKATMGFMLRTFNDWNGFSHAFANCPPTRVKPKSAVKCANEYASRWTWLECFAGSIGPITYARRYEVVDIIMHLLRERAKQLCPAALTTGAYGLLEHDLNFARMLEDCFSYTTLSHEEYQDLMEQKMFRLNRKFGRLALTQR